MTAADPEGRAREMLPGLLQFAKRLGGIGETVLEEYQHRQDDVFGYMIGVFLCKQLDHMQSVIMLQDRHDVGLIARSMLEGSWQLAWAANGRPERPRLWRAFAAVESWRTMQRDRVRGKTIAPEVLQAVEAQIRESGHEFLRSGRPGTRRIGDIEDPYHDTWRNGVSIYAVAREVGAADVHAHLYSGLSDWHHWGAAGVADVLSFEDNAIRYRGSRSSDQAVALSTAFLALWTVCDIAVRYRGLAVAAAVEEIELEYLKWNAEPNVRFHPSALGGCRYAAAASDVCHCADEPTETPTMTTVIVAPYDPAWRRHFDEEARRLAEHVGNVVVHLHHIGSTAIPGLPAKPIIDVLMEVTDLTALDVATPILVALGYEAMGEYGIPRRRYFRKNDASGTRTHHVHAFEPGTPEVERHLAFRDYMIAHPAAARAYGDLKQALALRHPEDSEAYMDGKDTFVKEHEALAVAWSRSQRNAPTA